AVRSAAIMSGLLAGPPSSAAAARKPSASLSHITIEAPALIRRWLVASPMPAAAPVTRMRRDDRSGIRLSRKMAGGLVLAGNGLQRGVPLRAEWCCDRAATLEPAPRGQLAGVRRLALQREGI